VVADPEELSLDAWRPGRVPDSSTASTAPRLHRADRPGLRRPAPSTSSAITHRFIVDDGRLKPSRRGLDNIAECATPATDSTWPGAPGSCTPRSWPRAGKIDKITYRAMRWYMDPSVAGEAASTVGYRPGPVKTAIRLDPAA
jgi:hypothetical protein